MSEFNKYYSLWEKYMPVITLQMKNATKGERSITLYKAEFQQAGGKNISKYTFTLDIIKGKVGSDITGIATARELYDKMMDVRTVRDLLDANDFNFTLGKDHVLKISVIGLDQPKEEEKAPVEEPVAEKKPEVVAQKEEEKVEEEQEEPQEMFEH